MQQTCQRFIIVHATCRDDILIYEIWLKKTQGDGSMTAKASRTFRYVISSRILVKMKNRYECLMTAGRKDEKRV